MSQFFQYQWAVPAHAALHTVTTCTQALTLFNFNMTSFEDITNNTDYLTDCRLSLMN